jgi:Flp pilus assembly protein TadG
MKKVWKRAPIKEQKNSVDDARNSCSGEDKLHKGKHNLHKGKHNLCPVVHASDSEEGSAITEFVLIATPLFIPALLFFMALQNTARQEISVENLARQTVRAFVTAETVSLGHQRIAYILEQYSELENKNGEVARFTYNISCGGQKCLTPGSRVRIDLYREFITDNFTTIESTTQSGGISIEPAEQTRKAIASATGIVDKWRE